MSNLFLTTVLLLVLAWPAGGLAQITVSFQPQVTVTGTRIVLADIAVIRPVNEETREIGRQPITSAPPPGQSKQLYTPSVINSLRHRKGLSQVDWQGSPTVSVLREGVRIGQDQMQRIILGYLKENSGRLPKTEIRFTLQRAPDDLTLPTGKLSWKVTPARPGIIGSTSFSIAFAVDGRPAGNCIVRGRLEAITEVVVARVNLFKGDQITEEGLNRQRMDIGGLDRPFTTTGPLIGKQMARSVTAGTPLEQIHVITPPVIREGEIVRIHAQNGFMELSATGQARGEGREGETIAVKNTSSGKIIQCRVIGPGEVSVEF